ncbi:MAG: hypothetical protein ACP5SH_26575, partial [Syntrophobacteraceae bacterium]
VSRDQMEQRSTRPAGIAAFCSALQPPGFYLPLYVVGSKHNLSTINGSSYVEAIAYNNTDVDQQINRSLVDAVFSRPA